MRSLAVGIDAAEFSLVRRLMAEGALPVLQRLAREGVVAAVRSPADLGSGAVWPSFMTGHGPERHGIYGEWQWNPSALTVQRPTFDHLEPFWLALASRGERVAVIDVPFARVRRHPGVVELFDWGAHDWLGGPVLASSAEVLALARRHGPHPLAVDAVDAEGPHDVAALARVVAQCREGIGRRGALARDLVRRQRPDVVVLVFPEVHRASHLLWHTVDPAHPLYPAATGGAWPGPGLPDLLRDVDREIGGLIDAAAPDATVTVFALHGMRPARGIPALLGDALRALGYLHERGWRDRSWSERRAAALSLVKRRVPAFVKRQYYARLPRATTVGLAQPSMPLPPCEWARTRAFSLPTDQHGWIRINLKGREARGAVEPSEYDDVCRALARDLLALETDDGCRLVERVEALAARTGDPPAVLPDLVVHWSDATLDADPRLSVTGRPARPIGLKFTGQHRADGFVIHRTRGPSTPGLGQGITAEALHALVAGA